jgi:uncharacterized protein involved in oxidation of intracellular sulfur
MQALLILNQPAYGADETYNAGRQANALVRRDDAAARVFLMGDAVTWAVAGRKMPDGYYALDWMLRSFARTAATSPAVASVWTLVASGRGS